MQSKSNCTRYNQNCTWLCLLKLVYCYSYKYSLIALKCMWLPIHIMHTCRSWWVDYKKLITYCSYTLKRSQFNSFNACDIILFPPASASPQLWVIKLLSHLYQNLTIPKQLRSLYFCILMSFLGWILYILSDDG